ncbi:MAG: cytochrome C oxidase subunit IV family protein [Gemmatimonadaceae bacterium]
MSHDSHSVKPGEHAHPGGWTYLKVAAILAIITVVEVWAYYVPTLVASPLFNPALIVLSAAKFAIVVLFYMHLKYDHRLFRALFTGPLIIAMATIVALLFLFHQLSIRF